MKHAWEVRAWLATFVLLFIAASLTPQRILNEWEWEILLLVVLPFLAWFVRLMVKEIREDG